MIDRSHRATALDELEHITNTLVTPNTHVPRSRSGHTDGEFSLHGVKELCVFNIHYGRDVAVRFPEIEGSRLGFIMAEKGRGSMVAQGKEVPISGREGLLLPEGLASTLHYGEDCETMVLAIDRHMIAQQCGKLLGREDINNVDFDPHIALDNAAGVSWLRLARYAADELSDPGSVGRNVPAALEQLKAMVTTGLLLSQSHNYSTALLHPQRAAAPYYVKRAEAYMEARFADSLSLGDVAAHVGVSARSLQNGFRNSRNMTPMEFLRSVRLRNVHAQLLAADPTLVSTTEIAMSAGFNHMGEFAALYKKVHGVPPSHTLWRGF